MQTAYYKTESDVALNADFTLELSGMATSLKWKPTKTTAGNVVSFKDGDGSYSSSYVTLDGLGKDINLLPHITMDFTPQSTTDDHELTRLRYAYGCVRELVDNFRKKKY